MCIFFSQKIISLDSSDLTNFDLGSIRFNNSTVLSCAAEKDEIKIRLNLAICQESKKGFGDLA